MCIAKHIRFSIHEVAIESVYFRRHPMLTTSRGRRIHLSAGDHYSINHQIFSRLQETLEDYRKGARLPPHSPSKLSPPIIMHHRDTFRVYNRPTPTCSLYTIQIKIIRDEQMNSILHPRLLSLYKATHNRYLWYVFLQCILIYIHSGNQTITLRVHPYSNAHHPHSSNSLIFLFSSYNLGLTNSLYTLVRYPLFQATNLAPGRHYKCLRPVTGAVILY